MMCTRWAGEGLNDRREHTRRAMMRNFDDERHVCVQ